MRAGRIAGLVLAAALVTACSTAGDVEVSGPGSTAVEPTAGTGAATTAARSTTTSPSSGSSAATPPSTTTAPASTTTGAGSSSMHTVTGAGKGAGYTISVPASWKSVDPSAGSPEDIAKQIAGLYPGGADAAQLAAAIRQGLVLFAIDTSTGANVNVLVQDGAASLDSVASQVNVQLSALGAAPATISRPTIGGREAVRADTSLTTPAAALTQLYIATDTQTFITTITTPAAASGVPVDAIATSITIS